MKEKIKIENLLSWTECELISGNPGKYIFNISTDSRTIKEGDFFIPVVGENYDGHDFIELALEKGACGFVFESQYSERLKLWEKSIKARKLNDLIIIKSQNNLFFLTILHIITSENSILL